MWKICVVSSVLALCLSACDKKKDAAEAPAAETQAPAEVAAAPANPEISAERVPLPEDFAAAAAAEINPDNAETQLAELEASLGTEG